MNKSSPDFTRSNAAYTILKIVLELMAGLLILITLSIIGFKWWIELPENRQWLQQNISKYAQEHLPENHSFHYEDFSLNLSTNPLGAKVTIKEATIQQPQNTIQLKETSLDFAFSDLLKGEIVPKNIQIDGLETHSNSTTQNATQFRSAERLAMTLLTWLTPDLIQDTKTPLLIEPFKKIHNIRTNDIKIDLGEGTVFTGDLQLNNNTEKSASLTGTFKDAVDLTLTLSRQGGLLVIDIHSIIPHHLIPEHSKILPAKSWLGEIGTEGALNAQIKIPISAITEYISILQSDLNLHSALKPLQVNATLDWPRDQTALQLSLSKKDQSTIQASVKSNAELPFPKIPNYSAAPIQALSVELQGSFDQPLSQFQLQSGQINLINGAEVTATGQVNTAKNHFAGDFTFKNLPHNQIYGLQLPKGLSLLAATFTEGSGKIEINQQEVIMHHLDTIAQNVQLNIQGTPASTPKINIEWRNPNRLSLAANQAQYDDITVKNYQFSGNPYKQMHGSGDLILPPRFVQDLIDGQFAKGSATLFDNFLISSNFELDIVHNDFQFTDIQLQSTIAAEFLERPLFITAMDYNKDDLENIDIQGIFDGAKFQTSRQWGDNHDKVVLNAPNLPISLADQLWREVTSQEITPLANFSGNLDLKLSADLSENYRQINAMADITNTTINHQGFGMVKEATEKGIFHATATQQNDHLWQMHLKAELPEVQAQVIADYDMLRHKVISLSDGLFNIHGDEVRFTANRHNDGLTFHLASPSWQYGAQLIQELKRDTSTLPSILTPISAIDWHFENGIDIHDLQFNRGYFSIQLQTHDQDGSEILQPNFKHIQKLTFDFAEPKPQAIIQNGGPDNDAQKQKQNLNPITNHSLIYVPKQKLFLRSPDAGKLLQALDVSQSLSGGLLDIALTPQKDQLAGKVTLRSFSVQDTSAAINFLHAVSLTGLLPLLADGGLPFFTLDADIQGLGKEWTVENLIAYGPGLSMTFDGDISLEHETVNGRGTASPTSIFNAILGSIPLISQIFTGTDGGGLVAVNYTAKGKIQKPEVETQPMSVLQLGILRNIFDGITNATNSDVAEPLPTN